MQLSKIW